MILFYAAFVLAIIRSFNLAVDWMVTGNLMLFGHFIAEIVILGAFVYIFQTFILRRDKNETT